jgi:hypothetical protein
MFMTTHLQHIRSACVNFFIGLQTFNFVNEKIKIYKAIILPFLYGFENWSVTLRLEHRLRVSENRVHRRKFGPKRHEVTGGCRKCIMRRSVIYTIHQIYFDGIQVKGDEIGGNK